MLSHVEAKRSKCPWDFGPKFHACKPLSDHLKQNIFEWSLSTILGQHVHTACPLGCPISDFRWYPGSFIVFASHYLLHHLSGGAMTISKCLRSLLLYLPSAIRFGSVLLSSSYSVRQMIHRIEPQCIGYYRSTIL